MSVEQDHRMRQLLAELEMTSNAPIASYNPSGGHSPFGSREPTTGDSWAPHLRYRRRYENAETDHAREKVIADAQKELQSIRVRTVPKVAGESIADRDRRLIRDGEGEEAQRVATAFRIGIRDVWRIRQQAGRDKDYGTGPKDGGKRPADERREKARELKRRFPGMSATMIAKQLGVDHKTVISDLRDAA